ncbi:formate dehydrogenase subunit gamma [Alsobacter sp. SYSU M60028]|uniref:Formate dehydrogenase subunit gamma n=1 Tax=Alsobacter ponti TaxID=2962936 RepID=A0ABT1L834_9HYPH|nr:formate dehydrogenase subunit gamma [Alsobacter ponti]MCP8937667.1 formate dehydrogenase subunit gamma [Alsobacter ponti]
MTAGQAQAAIFDLDEAGRIVVAHLHLDGALLPILHALQERFGYVPADAVPLVADALNLSRAEVHGVLTFYHDFRRAPAGRHVLKICRAESCQAMGCESLVEHLAAEHGVTPGGVTADGRLTVETVYCLGNCALSPAAMLDGELIGRLERDGLDALVNAARGARP